MLVHQFVISKLQPTTLIMPPPPIIDSQNLIYIHTNENKITIFCVCKKADHNLVRLGNWESSTQKPQLKPTLFCRYSHSIINISYNKILYFDIFIIYFFLNSRDNRRSSAVERSNIQFGEMLKLRLPPCDNGYIYISPISLYFIKKK